MILGERIKKAIEAKGLSPDEVAVHAGMVVSNMYKIFKRDSVESKYLEKIAEKLDVPVGALFKDETTEYVLQSGAGKQIQQAQRVGHNHQSINVGGMSKAECEDKLKDLQEKYDLARKSLVDKELIIEMLQGKKKED